jgi:hypothetical protein
MPDLRPLNSSGMEMLFGWRALKSCAARQKAGRVVSDGQYGSRLALNHSLRSRRGLYGLDAMEFFKVRPAAAER